MSVTSERLSFRANEIIKASLQNGEVPDELLLERQLREEFYKYYDPITNTYTINKPTWQATNLTYRETADVSKWNLTQASAAQEMYILYREFINDAKLLTDRLFDYTTAASLLRIKLSKLVGRIENLLLLADDSSGFLYSFFDTFNDISKISLDSPLSSTVKVDTDRGLVELSRAIDNPDVPGQGWEDEVYNLQFLQDSPSEVSFSILNPVQSSVPLSNATLPDIFNNKATAWQREITIIGGGPLTTQLTVRISPLDPTWVNKIEVNTKMANYDTQLMIQVFYSNDGVSYQAVQSLANPQYVGTGATFNFTPVYATHFRFIITKGAADSGRTYNIGFQSINFIGTRYNDDPAGDSLYSIPITFPDPDRPIGRVACEVCENKPAGTSIDYSIMVSGVDGFQSIPISPISEGEPKYSKIIDLGSLGVVSKDISTVPVSGYLLWAPASGYLSIAASGIASGINTNYSDTIAQSLEIYRGIGPVVSGLDNNVGFRVPPSGLGTDFFLTNILINNEAGTTIDFGATSAILDGKEVQGAAGLTYGLHQVATRRLDKHQVNISTGSDEYFAWNAQYVSPFDFYNNYSGVDPTVFTYDDGQIIINPTPSGAQSLIVDYDKTFMEGLQGNVSYLSLSDKLPNTNALPASGTMNAGDSVIIEVDSSTGNPEWINEVQCLFQVGTDCVIRIQSSMDNIEWTTVGEDVEQPYVGNEYFGSIIFNKPIYAKYIKVYIAGGSNINLDNSYFHLYPPIFKSTGHLYTENIYLPPCNTWDTISDEYNINPSQTYTIWNAFEEELLPVGTYTSDISAVVNPKVYLEVTSATLSPYVTGVKINSAAIPDERSLIRFAFHSNSSSAYKQIRFKAILKTTIHGVTPELSNYRVKIS